MSANVQTMMYTGQVPWHGIGKKVERELTAANAIKAAGLNWTVEKREMWFVDKIKQSKKLKKVASLVPNRFVVVKTDTETPLGVVGNKYTALQNIEAFSFFDAVVGEKAAIYHTAGALGQGERIWILAKIPGLMKVKGTKDDVLEKYMLLCNGHDGSIQVMVCLTNVRVVCQNTMMMAIDGAKNIFKMRHTANMGERVEDVRETLGIVNKWYDDFNDKLGLLTHYNMKQKDLDTFLQGMGFATDAESMEKASTREMNVKKKLIELFETGPGNELPGVKGTLWAAVNAVTDYVDHHKTFRKDGNGSTSMNRLNSVWFGGGNDMKQRAMKVASLMID